MSNGSFDYNNLPDREILLIIATRLDEAERQRLPQRVAALERWRSWITGGLAVIGVGLGLMEARRHG